MKNRRFDSNISLSSLQDLKSGVQLSEQCKDTGEGHICVLGSTGSFKSSCLVYPFVKDVARSKEDIIYLDPKGDGFRTTAHYFVEQGYNLHTIDLKNPTVSDGFNILTHAYQQYKSQDDTLVDKAHNTIELIGEMLYPANVDNDSRDWEIGAKSLFIGSVYTLFDLAESIDQVNLVSVYEIIQRGSKYYGKGERYNMLLEEAIDKFVEGGFSSEAGIRLSDYVSTYVDTAKGFKSTFGAPITKLLGGKGLKKVLCSTDDPLADLNKGKPNAFIIITPSENSSYDPLASLIVSIIIDAYYTIADSNNNGRLNRRLNIVLEEMGSSCVIPTFSKLLADSRSRQIRFMYVIQSLHQLYRYKEEANSILNNTQILISFRNNDYDNNIKLSHRYGRYAKINDDGTQFCITERLLPDDFMELLPRQAAIMNGNKQYIYTYPSPDFSSADFKGEMMIERYNNEKPIQVFDIDAYLRTKNMERVPEVLKNVSYDILQKIKKLPPVSYEIVGIEAFKRLKDIKKVMSCRIQRWKNKPSLEKFTEHLVFELKLSPLNCEVIYNSANQCNRYYYVFEDYQGLCRFKDAMVRYVEFAE